MRWWSFTEGELQARAGAGYTELRIINVPRPHHAYYELSVMGFAAGGLTFLGAKNLRHEALKGFTQGHTEILYRFHIT